MATVLCVGHAVHDFVFGVARLPDRGEKYRATGFQSVGGGPAATAAVTIARLGGRALLATRLGDDAVAEAIVAELAAYGVDCSAARRHPGHASSVSAVIVDAAGERMVVNHADPAMPRSPDWLPEPRAAGAQSVLADTRWPEGALRALGSARAAGLPGILDADGGIPRDGAVLRAASHVAFSDQGLREFSGIDDTRAALETTARDLPGWCCVTAGADGVLSWEAGRIVRHAAFRVPVVETLGAGDVWHGAFALALAEGRDAHAAVRFASGAAAIKVQRAGARSGAPTRSELDTFLAAHPSP